MREPVFSIRASDSQRQHRDPKLVLSKKKIVDRAKKTMSFS